MIRAGWIASGILALSATTVAAATLAVFPDKATYVVGETITLTVVGDPEGGADEAIFGRLVYDPALTETVGSSQEPHTSFGGSSPWLQGQLQTGDGFADVFNQIGGLTPMEPDQMTSAEAVLVAEAPGVVTVTWVDDGGTFTLDYFGLFTAPGTSFTIVADDPCTSDPECDDGDECTEDLCTNESCTNTPIDADGDGTPDCTDGCPDDPEKIAPGGCGCGVPDADSNGDGILDCSEVLIDVQPGARPNVLNPIGRGLVHVAILTTATFDALGVDPLMVCFGPDGAETTDGDCTEAHGTGHPADVDRDGDVDLLLHFEANQTGITFADDRACIVGLTFGGEPVKGCDSIHTVGGRR